MNKIGNNIKAARKAKGLTQKELAKLLNCSHTTVSKYEQGEIENMPRPRMNLLADILDISPIVLFDLVEIKKQPVQDELSEKKKLFIQRINGMSDEQLDRLEQIFDLIAPKDK